MAHSPAEEFFSINFNYDGGATLIVRDLSRWYAIKTYVLRPMLE